MDTEKHTDREGTGFGFDGETASAVLWNLIVAVHQAPLQTYTANKQQFRQIQQRGFNQRFFWSGAARRYIDEMYTR